MSKHHPEPFWLVWSPQGLTPPQHQHQTAIDATKEAERLARANPGQEFFVMQAVRSRKVDNMTRIEFYNPPF